MQKVEKTVFLLGGKLRPRIEKRIDVAKTKSKVILICWNQDNKEYRINNDQYTSYVFSKPSNDSSIWRIIPYLKYKKYVIQKLKEIAPTVIHAQNLHMMMIAREYALRQKKKPVLIYEVPDLQRMIVDKQTNPIKILAQKYLYHQDKICCKIVDLLIVTSDKYYEDYYKNLIEKEKVLYFPNVPDLSVFEGFQRKPHKTFTIGFIGYVRYKRQLMNLINISQECGIDILIAGEETDGNEIENAAKNMENIRITKKYDYAAEAASLYAQCDAIYSVYDADMNNCKVALPNKLYESVYCGLPIIVAKATYLAEVVDQWGVGVAVDHNRTDTLMEAVLRLKTDESYYNAIVENCKKRRNDIDLERYNQILSDRVESLIKRNG